jgi:hypothetical protein
VIHNKPNITIENVELFTTSDSILTYTGGFFPIFSAYRMEILPTKKYTVGNQPMDLLDMV